MEQLISNGPAGSRCGRGSALSRCAVRLRRGILAAGLMLAAGAGTGLPAHATAPEEATSLALARPGLPSSTAATQGPSPLDPQALRPRSTGRMPSYTVAQQVNHLVNGSTRYASDDELFGRKEFWTVAQGTGDCEDYALAKRAALLEAGVDPAYLRLLSGWIASGEYHLVLVVRTEQGDYVLDARHPRPMRRQDLEAIGYRWHSIEEGGRWFGVL